MIKGYKDWVEMRDFLSVFVPCILNHKEQHQQIADLILSFGIVKQHNITLSLPPLSLLSISLSVSCLSLFIKSMTNEKDLQQHQHQHHDRKKEWKHHDKGL